MAVSTMPVTHRITRASTNSLEEVAEAASADIYGHVDDGAVQDMQGAQHEQFVRDEEEGKEMKIYGGLPSILSRPTCDSHHAFPRFEGEIAAA